MQKIINITLKYTPGQMLKTDDKIYNSSRLLKLLNISKPIDFSSGICYNEYNKSKERTTMKFLSRRNPMKRYTLLNLNTGEIEIYEMLEKAIRNPIFLKYYNIIKEERI